jgi:hypothetical protein
MHHMATTKYQLNINTKNACKTQPSFPLFFLVEWGPRMEADIKLLTFSVSLVTRI